MTTLRTQLAGLARRPARLLITGLALIVAAFVAQAAIMAHGITERTIYDRFSITPMAADLVINGETGLSSADLRKVRAVPGVAEATGRRIDVYQIDGKPGSYLDVLADPGGGALAAVRVVQGRYPSGGNEIAVSPRTLARNGLTVGATMVLTSSGSSDGPVVRHQVTVTGVVTGDDDRGQNGYTTLEALAGWLRQDVLAEPNGKDPEQAAEADRVRLVELRVAPGADRDTVLAAVQQTITGFPGSPQVLTGDEVRHAEAKEKVRDVDDMFVLIAIFVIIAALAAGLVAASTFRIVFAQRMRQLALLRAVGGGRRAMVVALALEGACTGLLCGVVGAGAALAVGSLVPVVARSFDLNLSGAGLPVGMTVAVVVGTVLLAMAAVLAPAFSAAQVSPLEALRAASVTEGQRSIGPARWVLGGLLALGAVAAGWFVISDLPEPGASADHSPELPLLGTVGSGALCFLAVLVLGPVLIRPMLALVGWPVRRLGTVGRLAVGGVGGAPQRAAAISGVVALGVALVAGILVGGASLQRYVDGRVVADAPADFEVASRTSEQPLPGTLVQQVRQRAELTRVTQFRRAQVRVAGLKRSVDAGDLDPRSLAVHDRLIPVDGSLADLGTGRVILSTELASKLGVGVGKEIEVTAGSHTVRLRVVALLRSQPRNQDLIVVPADLDRLGVAPGPSRLLADAAGAGEQGRNDALRALQSLGADLEINVLADDRDDNDGTVNILLAIGLGLIGLTVLVAVVGVGTTVSLSVVERTRESGLLRALGMARGRLLAAYTVEASMYGILGSVIGLMIGLPYAWLLILVFNHDVPTVVPTGQLAVAVVILAALTAGAGVLPARRASRTSPVEAIGTDG